MIQYALLIDGCADRFGRGHAIPEGFTQVPNEIQYDDIPRMMLVSGEWSLRPVLQSHSVSGLLITLPGCPSGTAVEVSVVSTGTITHAITGSGDISLTMPEAGAYWVDILPPRPTMPKRFRVELAE